MATEKARVSRKLAAILQLDVVGYSRLMERDETGTLNRLQDYRKQTTDPVIHTYHGRIVKLVGDGALVEFPSVVEALACAVTMQERIGERNQNIPADRRIDFRIGINLGDVIIDGDDIYGDGVNVAARLEGLAEPGGICISEAVHLAVGTKLPLDYDDLGAQQVKNISEPVRIYRVRLQSDAVLPYPADTPADAVSTTEAKRLLPPMVWGALVVLFTVAVIVFWFQP